ncbi:TonB-dependent receptor [Aestuariibacter sp. AA17]|uniref:TonB-dependent receptor n=1 Tax=Fluctibacter corallii TaxID=2984329 RepID=A0ABT3A9S2_9ALTE|nr:TonB-dependent receptor [Aestuariibacter sp. AA17]MCV2885350.1 TonB-dependent receptor [Aestuariibacter sp. AA17]
MHKSLTQLAEKAQVTLLFPLEIAEQHVSQAVEGKFTVSDAIRLVIAGTELSLIKGEDALYSVGMANAIAPNPQHQPNIGDSAPEAQKHKIEKIAIVGTRSTPRTTTDSPVPIDIINASELSSTGGMDALSVLSSLIPSLNVNDQPINDASTLVRPANLRGLASDHTLILINGKRYHRSAVITFLGGGLSDGAQGPDLSTIPLSAIHQVEVLRDGAAAQYGSDAIAGVINFVLKNDANGGAVVVQNGGFFDGDGEATQIQWNNGFEFGSGGFVHLSSEFRHQNATSRSTQRDDAMRLINAGNHFVAEPAQHWGAPEIKYDAKFALNSQWELDSDTAMYSFANLSERKMMSGFYYRHPQQRQQVFVRGNDETPQLLVADLDGIDSGITCPTIPIVDDNVLDDTDYLLIADNQTEIGQNCFAFNEWFPGGFTPLFGGKLSDIHGVIGITYDTDNQWAFDLSATYGRSKIQYLLEGSINPSLGPDSPTSFKPGAAIQQEQSLRIDAQKERTVNQLQMSMAMGVEYRQERFEQIAGDKPSYQVGYLALDPLTGASQGFGAGSNGFNGFKPAVAGKWQRYNWASYADLEIRSDAGIQLGLAARYEHFSDFGNTFDGKVALMFDLSEDYSVRTSFSSGFKAPSVGQSNVVNITTAFFEGQLEDQITLSPHHPVAMRLGASALKPEQSHHVSLGWVGQMYDNFYVTVDYFSIHMRDRISTTSALSLTDDDIRYLESIGISGTSGITSAKYFANDFDTHSQGVDIVMSYDFDSRYGESQVIFNYNWTHTDVENVEAYIRFNQQGEPEPTSNITQQRIRMLENNLPQHRLAVTFTHATDAFDYLLRANYFGSYYEDHVDASAGYDIYAGSEWTLDAEVTYRMSSAFSTSLGAKNVLNNFPDTNPYQGLVGSTYPLTSPMGINGGFYYLRGIWNF